MKTCKACGYAKSLDEFHSDRSRKDGRNRLCKPCNRAQAKRWEQANRDRVNARQARYREEDPERTRARARETMRRRRVRIREQASPVYVDPCVFCGSPSDTSDHIRPLVKNGSDHHTNMAPMCLSCNQNKNGSDLLQFMLERKLT